MILPILIYNNPILRKKSIEITSSYPQLDKLISDMFETMYNAKGIGLAAPQIGINIRLFIIDIISSIKKHKINNFFFKKVFINPKIIKNYGEILSFTEGCLSIPDILESVKRKSHILIEYYNENWKKNIEILDNFESRVIQHEYDHIEGKLFIDHLSFIKRELIFKKLQYISKGKFSIHYPYKILK